MNLIGLTSIMQDPNTANQGDLIFKLDQDRAWLLKNLDKGKWPEIRSEPVSYTHLRAHETG